MAVALLDCGIARLAGNESPPISDVVVSPQRKFTEMGFLERDAILRGIGNKDFAVIFQAMLDAERVEHDPMKQRALQTTLGFAMGERTPSQEFVEQMDTFINNSSNLRFERQLLLGALGQAATNETVDLLIRIATSSPDADMRKGATGYLGTVGNLSGAGEKLSPALERVWRESNDQYLLSYVAISMAKIGTPSSIELLLVAALTGDGSGNPRKLAAQYALVEVYMSNAVPPLSARLANHLPASEAGKLIAPILVRIGDATAGKAIVGWMQWIPEDAGPFIHHLVVQETRTPDMLAAWRAALDPAVPFRNERNREAIRAGYDIRKH